MPRSNPYYEFIRAMRLEGEHTDKVYNNKKRKKRRKTSRAARRYNIRTGGHE